MTTVGTAAKWRRLAVELTEHVARGNHSAADDLLGRQEGEDVWAQLLHALLGMFNQAAREFLGPAGLLAAATTLMALDVDSNVNPDKRLAARLILLHGWATDAAEPTDSDGIDWYNLGAELFNGALEDAEAHEEIHDGGLVAITCMWLDLLPVLRTPDGLCLLARWADDERRGDQ